MENFIKESKSGFDFRYLLIFGVLVLQLHNYTREEENEKL